MKATAETARKAAPKAKPAPVAEPAAKVAEPVEEAVVETVEIVEEAVSETVEVAPAKAEETKEGGKDLFGAEEDPDAGKPSGLLAERPADADDLKEIKGVGPKVEAELNALGIYTFKQIAGFTEENLAWLARSLGSVRGRGLRSDFVEQARALAG